MVSALASPLCAPGGDALNRVVLTEYFCAPLRSAAATLRRVIVGGRRLCLTMVIAIINTSYQVN
jgi:hypothetical protein